MGSMLKQAFYLGCGIVALAAPLFGVEWETDIDAALARAQDEDKAVLVDFTGSDWCTWCIKLRKDVLDTPAFTEYAQDRFVLLEVDVPQDAARVGGEAKAEANRQLCEKFNVRGFPTLMVMSAEGIPLARLAGYRRMPALQPKLNAALEVNKALRAARPMQGLRKAQALMDVYAQLDPQEGAVLLTQIAACDPDNVTQIREVQKSLALQNMVDAKLWDARTPADIQAARSIQAEAIKLLPESMRARAKDAADARFANADAMMHRSRSKPRKSAEVVRPQAQPKPSPEPTLSEEEKRRMTDIVNRFNSVGEDVDSRIRVLEEALPTASPTMQFYLKRSLINVLMFKLEQLGRAARSVQDVYKLRPYMQRVVDLLPPETRPAAQKDLDDKFRNPTQTLIQLKMSYGSN